MDLKSIYYVCKEAELTSGGSDKILTNDKVLHQECIDILHRYFEVSFGLCSCVERESYTKERLFNVAYLVIKVRTR